MPRPWRFLATTWRGASSRWPTAMAAHYSQKGKLNSRCWHIRERDNRERGNVGKWPILFSNSGSGCQALYDHPCRAHCSLRGRGVPSA